MHLLDFRDGKFGLLPREHMKCFAFHGQMSLCMLTRCPRTHLCKDGLEREGFGRFVRGSPSYADNVRTVLFGIQPVPAWAGIVGCILVFAFASATWWATPVTFIKAAAAYGTVSLPLL